MPYNPGVTYDTSQLGQGLTQLGSQISKMTEEVADRAKKSKSMRAMLKVYDPEGKDRYESMGHDQLAAEITKQTLQRAEEDRQRQIQVQQATMANIKADNERATEFLTIQRDQAERAKSNTIADNRRADAALALQRAQERRLGWTSLGQNANTAWANTLTAKARADEATARGAPPKVIKTEGQDFLQSYDGGLHPLPRTELTKAEKIKASTDLVNRVGDLFKQMQSISPGDPTAAGQRRALTDEISRARLLLDDLGGAPKQSSTQSLPQRRVEYARTLQQQHPDWSREKIIEEAKRQISR